MKNIYTAKQNEIKSLTTTNQVSCELIVMVNDSIIDNVFLAEGKDNQRVIDLNLNKNDVVLVNDTDLITFEIK